MIFQSARVICPRSTANRSAVRRPLTFGRSGHERLGSLLSKLLRIPLKRPCSYAESPGNLPIAGRLIDRHLRFEEPETEQVRDLMREHR